MPTGATAVLPYPKTPQSPRLLHRCLRHHSGLHLLLATASPFCPETPPLSCPRRKPTSTTVHASSDPTASSFPSSPTPPPLPAREHSPEPPSTVAHAGRSKKNKKPAGGRIEGGGDVRHEAKSRARVRSRRLSNNAFYRWKRHAASGQADAFTDEELEMIGLGYDRSVLIMDGPDDSKREFDASIPFCLDYWVGYLLSHGICQFLVFIPSRRTNAKG